MLLIILSLLLCLGQGFASSLNSIELLRISQLMKDLNSSLPADYHSLKSNFSSSYLTRSHPPESIDNSHVFAHLNQSDYADLFGQTGDLSSSLAQAAYYHGKSAAHTLENCYIITLKSGVPTSILSKLGVFLGLLNGQVVDVYERVLQGTSICFPNSSLPLSLLQRIHWIQSIERDQVISNSDLELKSPSRGQVQTKAPWGLSRLSQPKLPLDYKYRFEWTGANVDVYVLDSGVEYQHKEFESRAKFAYNAISGESEQSKKGKGSSEADCYGHGTEVSSVIAGLNTGVAKRANILSVQVLGCNGQGKNSDLIRGLEWILRQRAITNARGPCVINMSLGGPKSAALDRAVQHLLSLGYPVVVAAGNTNSDACEISPAGLSHTITVAASTDTDHRASFSNYGPCVDIFAPGSGILVASPTAQSGYAFASGTSLAAPFVTGVIALLLERNSSASLSWLWDQLKGFSVEGVLQEDSLMFSPNLLVQAPPLSSNLTESETLVPLSPPSSLPTESDTLGLGVASWALIIGGSLVALALSLFLIFWIRRVRHRRQQQAQADLEDRILSQYAPEKL